MLVLVFGHLVAVTLYLMSGSHSVTAVSGGAVFDSNVKGLKVGHLNVVSLNPHNPKFVEMFDLIQTSELDVVGISETMNILLLQQ